jgi:hypothetical protein
MTPKEKAIELYQEFLRYVPAEEELEHKYAKQCALIAVDEIINSEPRNPSNVDWDDCGGTHEYYYEAQREEADKYWREVKQEIENL